MNSYSHTHQYLRDNLIHKLEDLFNWKLASRVFKSLKDPNNDSFMFDAHYSYSTRYGYKLVLPRFNLAKTQSSFVHRKLLIWNEISSNIKSIENYLISNY